MGSHTCRNWNRNTRPACPDSCSVPEAQYYPALQQAWQDQRQTAAISFTTVIFAQNIARSQACSKYDSRIFSTDPAMAPPHRSRNLKKGDLVNLLKPAKPTLLSESTRVTAMAPKINSISWSPTGTLIATCTGPNIRVWNSERPNVKSSIELRNAHPKQPQEGAPPARSGASGETVERVAFAPTMEGVLASCGMDGTVRLFDVRAPGAATAMAGKGTPLADCKVGGECAFLTWHPNGQEMLVGRRDDVIHSVDLRWMPSINDMPTFSMEAEKKLERDKNLVLYGMSFSNSGREVFAGTNDGSVLVLDYPSMSVLTTLSGHPGPCYTAAHSPIGAYVAVGSADATISLWDTHNWISTHTLATTSQQTSVRDLSFSFDGQYLIAGAGSDNKDGAPGLNIYHVDLGEVVHTVETTSAPSQVAWHPNRYWMAYAGDPGGLKIVGSGSIP